MPQRTPTLPQSVQVATRPLLPGGSERLRIEHRVVLSGTTQPTQPSV